MKYKDILFGNKKISDYQIETIYEVPEEEYHCRIDGSCFGHPMIAIDVFNESTGELVQDIIGYRMYDDGRCKHYD